MSSCCDEMPQENIKNDVNNTKYDSIDDNSSTSFLPIQNAPIDKKAKNPWVPITLILGASFIFTQFYDIQFTKKSNSTSTDATVNTGSTINSKSSVDTTNIQNEVLPVDGVVLPIKWGDIGKKMIDSGVIDEDKFRQLFGETISVDQEKLLTGVWTDEVILNQENSRFFLDVLWAFGLGNKNPILTEGEMTNEQYGGAGNFASTGGWTLANGDAMDHYSMHTFVTLTSEQQELVDQVSRGIFRPCCGNSTHFPDCNHGMAMLGLLQLLSANGATKDEMFETALGVNSLWFPQTYIDLAMYFQEQGQDWKDVDPATVLGQEYSSAQGYQATRAKIQSLPKPQSSGGGCGA